MSPTDEVPTLRHGDVVLRALCADDLEGVVEQCNDPETIQWTTVPQPYGRHEAEQLIATSAPSGWLTGGSWTFAIESTHADGERRFSGSVNLRPVGKGVAEIGFGAHPGARGHGVMTAAIRRLLDWGFTEKELAAITWKAHAGNWASRRVAWKCGFTVLDGSLPGSLEQRGERRDAWVGSITRDQPRTPASTWLSPPVIESDRVRLRPMRDDDADAITEACRDERTQWWLPLLPSPYTRADAEWFINHVRAEQAAGRQVQWTVADPQTDELLGVVGLPRMDSGQVSAEIGYWTHPAARGRGVMSAAVAMVVRHGFIDAADGGLGLNRLEICAADGNEASQHIALANGFTRSGTMRSHDHVRGGGRRDLFMFDLLATEWLAQQ